MQRLLKASGLIKFSIADVFSLFYEINWGWPRIESAGRVMSHACHVVICELAAICKPRRLPRSSLSEIFLSASQVTSSIYYASEGINVSDVDGIGEDRSMMCKTYRGPLLIRSRCQKFPWSTFRVVI